jgi:hypothetical protein
MSIKSILPGQYLRLQVCSLTVDLISILHLFFWDSSLDTGSGYLDRFLIVKQSEFYLTVLTKHQERAIKYSAALSRMAFLELGPVNFHGFESRGAMLFLRFSSSSQCEQSDSHLIGSIALRTIARRYPNCTLSLQSQSHIT